MSDIIEVSSTEMPELVIDILKAGLVPNITGSPGIGKSDIIRQVAKDTNLKVIDLRLAQMDPVDLCGMPSIKSNKTKYIPPSTFPIEGDEIPTGYTGWLLFLDEMNSAPMSVQSAALTD